MASTSWSHPSVRVTLVRSLLIAFVSLATSVSAARAQWENMNVFGSDIVSIYFHKDIASGQMGFVGLANGQIHITMTAGQTWSQTTSPATHPITGFTWKDDQMGWASYKSSDQDPTEAGGVLKTTDGGMTWTNLTLTKKVSAVYYNPGNGRLMASQWNDGSMYSSDEGATWNILGSQDWNGYAFVDNNRGFVGILQGQSQRTTNGGVTWIPSPLLVESWAPLAIPNTNMMFAASEADGVKQIFRSYNAGISWEPLKASKDKSWTGDMDANCNTLFAQTTDEGFYASFNHGDTWVSLGGPPNAKDHGFSVAGEYIYAGSPGGTFWRYQLLNTGGAKTLMLTKDPIRINSRSCTPVDSLLQIRIPAFCTDFRLLDIELTGSPSFSLKSQPSVPKRLGGADSIYIRYSSLDFNRDSGFVRLRYSVDGEFFDTTILIIGNRSKTLNIESSYSAMSKRVRDACTPIDTVFSFTNSPCDEVRLLSIELTDPSVFRITPPALPMDLGPSERVDIPITAVAAMQGSYGSAIRLKFLYAGVEIDTLIPLEYIVQFGPTQGRYDLPRLKLANPCTVVDTALFFQNRLCDTLWLESVNMTADRGVTTSAVYPIPAVPTKPVRFPIRIQGKDKGKHTTTITLTMRGPQGSYDTTVTFEYEVIDVIPRRLSYPSVVNFGNTSICSPRSHTVYIKNPICEEAVITGISWITPDPTISVIAQPTLPATIAASGQDSITLGFAPTSSTNFIASLRITFTVRGIQADTFISISGRGVTSANTSISASTLTFDSIYSCESNEQFTYIRNDACDSVTVVSMIQPGGAYTILEPQLPFGLKPGDSVKVRFRTPTTVGTNTESVIFTVRSGAAESQLDLLLTGVVDPPLRKLEVGSTLVRFSDIIPCSHLDTVIRFYNRGICDNITIQSLGVETSNWTTATSMQQLPHTIAPGESIDIQLSFAAGFAGETDNGLVRLRGPGLDTVLTLDLATMKDGGTGQLALTLPVTTFTVRPCENASSTGSLLNDGCEAIVIDGISIEPLIAGQLQYTIAGLPNVPHTLEPGQSLNFTITFDGNSTGNGQANLVIATQGGKYDRAVALSGTINGTVGEFAISVNEIGGQPAISRAVGENLTLQIKADRAADPGHELTEASFDLMYDTDLLTPLADVDLSGWTVDRADIAGGTRLTLRKNANAATSLGDVLGEIEFYTTLSRNTSTMITAQSLVLNGGDQQYAKCRMTAGAATSSIKVDITPACGDSSMRLTLLNKPLLSVVGLSPNPAEEGRGVKLDVELGVASAAKAALYDVSGNSVGTLFTGDLGEGSHSVLLQLPQAIEGIYFLRFEAAGFTDIRKIVVGGK